MMPILLAFTFDDQIEVYKLWTNVLLKIQL